MCRQFRVVALFALCATPLCADPGGAVSALKDYTFGPLMYVVIALGMITCLFQFSRGNKAAAIYIIAALLFLAAARSLIQQWFSSPSAGTGMAMGDFPYYGQSPGVQVPGEAQSYDDIRAWGFLGLLCCHSITMLMFNLGLPVLIASVGAMVGFHRIAIRQQAGSVITYLLACIVIGAFCLFPAVSYAPADATVMQHNDVITALSSANSSAPNTTIANADSLTIPLLPALLLSGGVDLCEAIGLAINPNPASAYPTQFLTAARHAALPEAWLGEYADYSAQCAAAQQGFITGEPQNPTAVFSQSRWREGVSQTVDGASLNLLSPWGDSLMALIPVHGYTINDPEDVPSADIPQQQQLAVSAAWRWVPNGMDTQDSIATVFDSARLGSGLPGGQTPGYKPIAAMATPPGANVWMRPKGLPVPGFATQPGATWIVPFCSVPDDCMSAAPLELDVDRANGSTGAVGPWASYSGTNVTDQSAYLTEMAQAVALPAGSTQSYAVFFSPYDWGEELRNDLLGQFSSSQCLTACGNPEHKYFWGCLVTGAFIQIETSTPGSCTSSADATRAFYGQNVAGTAYPNYEQLIASGLYGSYALKARDTSELSSCALAGTSILSASVAGRRAAVDAIMGAPGTYSQNSLAHDAYSFPSDTSSHFSLWDLFSKLPQMALWLLALFGTIAVTLISFLWPHIMGIATLLLLTIYPLFACLALWPGKWLLLFDWSRGMLWVLLWAPVATFGFALINSGSYLTQQASLLSATPGPGQSLLTLLGVVVVLMSPAIAQAIVMPSLRSVASLASMVYGTSFKVLGIATQLAIAAGGAALGAAAAGAGAAAGMRTLGGGVGSGVADDSMSSRSTGGPSAESSEHPVASRILRGASAGGRWGLSAGRNANVLASQVLGVVDSLGATGLAEGAARGADAAQLVYQATKAAGLAGFAGARIAAHATAVRYARLGSQPSASPTGRIAQDLSGSRGPGPQGMLGDLLAATDERFGSAGDPSALALFANAEIAALMRQQGGALQAGDAPGALRSARALAGVQHDHAQALLRGGDRLAATEALKAYADTEIYLAHHDPQASMERAHGAVSQSLRAADDLEQEALTAKDVGAVQAARRIRADAHAGQSALFLAQAGPQGDDVLGEPGLRQRARLSAAKAMAGYAQALPFLSDELREAAPAAARSEEIGLRRLAGCAAALTGIAAQAIQLHEVYGDPIPEELQVHRVAAGISRSTSISGPVGGPILSAITAAATGDNHQVATSLQQASVAAERQGLGPDFRRALTLLSRTSSRGMPGDCSSVSRQTRFMRQMGDAPALGDAIEGLRHLDGLPLAGAVQIALPGAPSMEITTWDPRDDGPGEEGAAHAPA